MICLHCERFRCAVLVRRLCSRFNVPGWFMGLGRFRVVVAPWGLLGRMSCARSCARSCVRTRVRLLCAALVRGLVRVLVRGSYTRLLCATLPEALEDGVGVVCSSLVVSDGWVGAMLQSTTSCTMLTGLNPFSLPRLHRCCLLKKTWLTSTREQSPQSTFKDKAFPIHVLQPRQKTNN